MNEKINLLIQEFSIKHLTDFLAHKNHNFAIYSPPLRIYEEETEKFQEIYKAGELNLKDGKNLFTFAIKTQGELTERSSKKAQYDLAKKLITREYGDCGLFVFYDENGNFRFSLVYKIYSGTKAQFSYYRRYTYYVEKGKPYRTFLKALTITEFETLEDIISAFQTQPLTKEFYTEIQNWFAWALKEVRFPGGRLEENLIRLLTRLIFVWFLKEKKLIPEEIFDENFLKGIVRDFGKADYYYNAILQNLFFATLNRYPEERKFAVHADFPENRTEFGVKTLFRYKDKILIPERDFIEIFNKVPFINGGLFECLDENSHYIDGFSRNEAKRAKLPDYLFFGEEKGFDLSEFYGEKKKVKVRGLINILKDYNFTADESSPIDIEVSLDPELLGHIFENLLASYNPETQTTARKATGSYYTPKEIVDFMVEESLIGYFKTKTNLEEDRLRNLLSYSEEKIPLSNEEKQKLINAIDTLKVLDPAVGSGAFPMGVVHKLVHILSKIDPDNELWYELQFSKALHEVENVLKIKDKETREQLLKEVNDAFDESINYPDYARKLYIIENSIYGVDIQPIAIQISKLRFFLSLLIDQKVDFNKKNFGIKPLPHLETKFVSANALISLKKAQLKEVQLSLQPEEVKKIKEKLKELYRRHFSIKTRTEKKRIQEKANALKEELKGLLKKNGWPDEEIDKIVSFDIFSQTSTANWFDPEWMFGLDEGFDILIGNPPHGANMSDYLNQIMPNYNYYDSRKNSASFFMFLANKLLKKGGVCAYIIPKSLSYVEGWRSPRDLLINKNQLLIAVDISKSFENVLLEQIVVIYKNAPSPESYKIRIGCGWDKSIKIVGKVEKNITKQLDIIPCYLDKEKMRIFEKLQKNSMPLSQISETFRGLPWQRKVSNKGETILRGKNIGRYFIKETVDKITLSPEEQRSRKVLRLRQKKIVSQNIVAHVMNPYDHIIIMATLDNQGLLTLDTCMNTLLTNSNYTYEYILALLNSSLASWYYYWFVYNRAIRTMHFDEYYIGKLPVKKIPLEEQKPFISLVNEILSLKSQNPDANTSSIEKEIEQMIYKIYELDEDEISLIENKI